MQLYYDVRATGLPNYLSLRREVPSQMNCDKWDELLSDYDDKQVADFIRFGWPVTYTARSIPISTTVNHASALRHQSVIDKFIDKEKRMEALLGPFDKDPFAPWTKVSPLMTRDKKEGEGKRVIIDLSYPPGGSVNEGILKNNFQGEEYYYTLPTPLDLAERMLKAGQGAYLWKSDLQRAYRQLRIDPLDYPLLAIRHKGHVYLDVCPSFGCRCSGSAQQRVSNALTHLMKQKGHDVLAYVDDFCSVAPSFEQAMAGFTDFEALTKELGVKTAPDKTVFPTTKLEFLGIEFDSNEMVLSIPEAKLTEVI